MFPISESTVELAQAFEGIVSDARRHEALNAVLAVAAADAAENPNKDTGI